MIATVSERPKEAEIRERKYEIERFKECIRLERADERYIEDATVVG